MNRDDVLEFVNRNKVFFLATTDGPQARVRAMRVHRADDRGILFSTGSHKDVHRQLADNPRVEMCFYSSGENRQVRISGKVVAIEDLNVKRELVEEYPFLKDWVDEKGYDALSVFALKGGHATLWTMETNVSPKEIVEL